MFKGLSKPPLHYVVFGFILILFISAAGYFSIFHPVSPFRVSPLPFKSPNGGAGVAEAQADAYSDNLWLMARVIQGEAAGEPFLGKVAVGAVLMNRVQNASFPKTLAGVIFEPYAFESVSNGLIWQSEPSDESIQAAQSALSGWDPTYGSIFFWNPSKPVSPWMWTREIVTQIGNHVFAR